MDPTLARQVRQARGKFVAMAAAYALGAFNDNFFRQAANQLAIDAGREYLQNWFMVVFTAPYLLLAAPAGWLADRFPKRRVVIAAKALELAAMCAGAYGVLAMSWPCLGAMVCVMGLQSCLFSPSLNGSIPELYPAEYVTRANGRLKVAVTAAILLGVTMAGVALSRSGALGGIPLGRVTVAAVAVSVSVVGLIGSALVPSRPAANPGAPFPWTGPLHTIGRLGHIVRTDRLLAAIIGANVFVWFAGSVMILVINVLAMRQFAADPELVEPMRQIGGPKALASYLAGVQVAGLAVGGLLAGRVASGPGWHRVLPVAAGSMGSALLIVGFVPTMPAEVRIGVTFACLTAAGLMGGLYMIPCEAFIQVRPLSSQRGSIIAAGNFAVFAGLILSGPAADGLYRVMPASSALAVLGAAAVLVGAALHLGLAKEGRSCSRDS